MVPQGSGHELRGEGNDIDMTEPTASIWLEDFRRELTGNILPFWMTHAIDERNGGMHGALTNDLQVQREEPRSAVLATRVLWTFSAAFRQLGDLAYREMAVRAFNDLVHSFWDDAHGGVVWTVDRAGHPVSDRKHHYAQAFALYGLSEYVRATGSADALERCRTLFDLLERHAYDKTFGGYVEGSTRTWQPLVDARLSDRDLDCRKSMNTNLHLLEAYTNLHHIDPTAALERQLVGLLEIALDKILDRSTGHLRLFFDDDWTSLLGGASFGHDIEASWLLHEAALEVGDPDVVARAASAAKLLAETVFREGVDADGSLFTEVSEDGVLERGKDWWPQAEAVVGFYNAFELTGDPAYAGASRACWNYAKGAMVDPEHGGWIKRIDERGHPDPLRYKSGPWECPYHQSRACLEMMRRLGKAKETA